MEGRILANRYCLQSQLGQGGMGSVWRAQHLALGTPVAIKLIDPSIAQDTVAIARFKREAQAAAELRSAHVVQIIDYGAEDDTPFIAMELLDGETLAARLERVCTLPPATAATILSQVARALTRAHAAGIVHRDLKPENIFLVPEADDEIAKVLDFGIAKKVSILSTTAAVKTGTGTMLGTPHYMSPEQALGQGTIDHRTDIWSLGVIAYQCLTGVRPFERDTLGALVMAICGDAMPTPSLVAPVPSGFDAWFARAAARDPEERFASAADAAAELRAICGVTNVRLSGTSTPGTDPLADSGPRELAASATSQTPAVLDPIEVPSSVTIGGLIKRRLHTPLLAAIGVIAIITTGLLVALGLRQRGSNAASLAPMVSQPTHSAAAPPETTTPIAAAAAQSKGPGTVSLTAPSGENSTTQGPGLPGVVPQATAATRAQEAVRDSDSSRTATGSPSAKSPASVARAVAVPPPNKPAASTSRRVPPRNYDESVGF